MTADETLFAIAHATATKAHEGQRRRHGAPYISHPRAVTTIATDLGYAVGLPLTHADRAAAILHDVIEDNLDYDEAVLAGLVGVDVAHQVALLSKAGNGHAASVVYYSRLTAEASSRTKLLKVADRLHNLSELHKAHDDDKLDEYIAETEEFVVALARSVAGAAGAGLVAAVLDGIDNARRSGTAIAGRTPTPAAPYGLYAIIQPSTTWAKRLEAVLHGGASRVQLRVKPGDGLTDRQWLALLGDAAVIADRFGVEVVANDRADLAFAAGVGVHVGDTDLPPSFARRLLGPRATIGTSTHSVQQLLDVDSEGGRVGAAGDAGADHLALGPVWASPTKQGHAALVGLEALRTACASTQRPVVAIGGIVTPDRAADVVAAGAAFACAVSAFAGGDTGKSNDDVDGDDSGGESAEAELVWRQARRFAIAVAAARGTRDAST